MPSEPCGTQYCDFVVVGAGIVGLTVAYRLRQRHPSARIAVVEKEGQIGCHASGRNSGVLHSGIYYPPGSKKAAVCASGARQMKEFAREHGIKCVESGKVILPYFEADHAVMQSLLENAQRNGVRAERLDAKGLKELEPFARECETSIFVASTAVVDIKGILKALQCVLQAERIIFHLGASVRGADVARKAITINSQELSFGYLFNCAGAYADVIARMFGLAADYALVPFKGLYFKLSEQASELVRSSIYPVPDLRFPFLGVHLTRDVHGDVYVGPTAIPALGRENYGILRGLEPVEAAKVFWRLSSLYLHDQQGFRRLVHRELKNYRRSSFWEAARRLVPALRPEHLEPTTKSGIRPQLVGVKDGRLEMDFVVESGTSSTHVLNAISPAFTSSFELANVIVKEAGF